VTAQNHALTGAFIGLTVNEPWLAVPLAFLSHFACDAIPHHDPPGGEKRVTTKRFIFEYLVGGAALCLLLVIILAYTKPHNWLLACICAFIATSPDLFWIPRFIKWVRSGKDHMPKGWFFWFHDWIQWKTGPQFWWVEAIWFIVFGTLVAARL